MEIKLTADWILLNTPESIQGSNGSVLIAFDKPIERLRLKLFELTLKNLDIKATVEETDSYFYFLFKIDKLKKTCPEFYKNSKKLIDSNIKAINKKRV